MAAFLSALPANSFFIATMVKQQNTTRAGNMRKRRTMPMWRGRTQSMGGVTLRRRRPMDARGPSEHTGSVGLRAGWFEPLGDQIAALRAAGATMIYKEKFRAFAPIARSLRK
jgi:hypothetical protein